MTRFGLFILSFTFLLSTSSQANDCRSESYLGERDPSSFSRIRQHNKVMDMFQQIGESTFLARSSQGNVVVYDYKSQEIIRTMQVHSSYFTDTVLASPDGKIGVNASPTQISIFDIETGELRAAIDFAARPRPPNSRGHLGYSGGYVSKDSKRAVLIGQYGDFVVLDLEKNQIVWKASQESGRSFFSAVKESPDGRYLLGSRWEDVQVLYDRKTDTGRILARGETDRFRNLYDAEFSLDSKSIYYRSLQHTIVRYDIADEVFAELNSDITRIDSFRASRDQKYFIFTRYLYGLKPGEESVPFYVLDGQTLQRIPLELPAFDVGEYPIYILSKNANAFLVFNGRDRRKMLWLDLNTMKASIYQLPQDYLYPMVDLTWDGRSFFRTTNGEEPKISEVY